MGFTFPKFVPTPLSQLIPNASEQAIDLMMRMMTFDPQKRITAAQALKHPWFEDVSHNPAALTVALKNSESNKNLQDKVPSTNPLGSGGKVPGSRAIRIESRKGILSRKSSVNKNSFYKQKAKDSLPSKLYGVGYNPLGSGNNRGASSYFNKNAPVQNNSGIGLPRIQSRGAA